MSLRNACAPSSPPTTSRGSWRSAASGRSWPRSSARWPMATGCASPGTARPSSTSPRAPSPTRDRSTPARLPGPTPRTRSTPTPRPRCRDRRPATTCARRCSHCWAARTCAAGRSSPGSTTATCGATLCSPSMPTVGCCGSTNRLTAGLPSRPTPRAATPNLTRTSARNWRWLRRTATSPSPAPLRSR